MTAITKKPENPIAHLTPEDIEQLGVELDAIRQDILDDRGEADAAYIRRVINVQRTLELGSRAVLLARRFPPAWVVGTAGLSVAKILENMEIGHNVLHGQWDWMRDPKIHSTTWEWDMATPGRAVEALAQRAAPHLHEHRRQGQRPRLRHHARRRGPALAPVLPRPAAVELHQRLLLRVRHRGLRPRARRDHQARSRPRTPSSRRRLEERADQDPQAGHQGLRRPPGAVAARPARSCRPWPRTSPPTWSATCGATRSSCAATSPRASRPSSEAIDRDETRGEWYVRQMLGSANISGSKLMHIMTGNLCHQIEHHLFPDLPSQPVRRDRAEGAGAVREVRPQLPHGPDAAAGRLAPGTRWSGSRCPTAGWPPPTPEPARSSSSCSTRWPPVAPRSAARRRPGSSSRPASSRRLTLVEQRARPRWSSSERQRASSRPRKGESRSATAKSPPSVH